jgi:hypothetical protein
LDLGQPFGRKPAMVEAKGDCPRGKCTVRRALPPLAKLGVVGLCSGKACEGYPGGSLWVRPSVCDQILRGRTTVCSPELGTG